MNDCLYFNCSVRFDLTRQQTFLEFLKEVLKGIVCAISVYLFQKTFLNNEKTTRRRSKQRVVFENNILTTTACTAMAAKRIVDALLVTIYIHFLKHAKLVFYFHKKTLVNFCQPVVLIRQIDFHSPTSFIVETVICPNHYLSRFIQTLFTSI